jgi:hypothetical protein
MNRFDVSMAPIFKGSRKKDGRDDEVWIKRLFQEKILLTLGRAGCTGTKAYFVPQRNLFVEYKKRRD